MLKKLSYLFFTWVIVALVMLILFRVRDKPPLKDFISWSITNWPILAAIGGLGVILSTWIIKHDFNKNKLTATSHVSTNTESKLEQFAKLHPRKLQAQNIHSEIMELDLLLEKKKEGLSRDENWNHNLEIKDVLDKMQTELNALGYLVNNRSYDRWAEDMMHLHSKELHFHYKDNDMYTEWGRARINAKLRDFVNKVKG